MNMGDLFAEVIRDYTRLEHAGPVRDGEPDVHNDLEYAARLEGMRRAIAILNEMPPEESAEGGDVGDYIAAWQSSHHAFLFKPDGTPR